MKITLRQAIAKAQNYLDCLEDARFDALCLAEHAFGLSKTQLRLQGEQLVDATQYNALVRRRRAGEPLQYLLGQWEFFGLPFAVGPGVLIPRPETELLVDFALQFLAPDSDAIVYDLCAGSGCVGLSVAHYRPSAQINLLELSGEALPYLKQNAVAYQNATILQVDIEQVQNLNLNCQLILANPPYIITGEIDSLSREVRHEPRMALDGGADGLRFYRVLAERWWPVLALGGAMAMECGEGQAAEIAHLFAGAHVESLSDFNGIERIVVARNIP
jgi:release factor glutamine methyltransferase